MNNKKFNKLNSIIYKKVIDLYQFLNKRELFELAKRMNIENIKIQKEGELLKFRGWEPNFQSPKDVVVKTDIIKYGASRKHQNIIKRVLYAKIEKFEDFKNRWVNKNKLPKFWGNAHQIPFYEENNWLWIKLHDNWFFDNIIPKPEDFVYMNKWLYYRIPKNYVGISYISGEGHAHFILVPSKIKKDNAFFEGLGLQQGDGTQSLSDVHITFTNGCEDLVIHQIDWFKKLGISTWVLRFYPEIPNDKLSDFYQIKNKLISIGIKQLQFRKGKSKLSNTKNVLIQLVFHNKLFKLAYLYLLYNSRDIILKNKDWITSYLKGILASEGSVKVRKDSRLLSAIKISASSENTRNFYKNCLRSIGIIPSKDELTKGSEAVMITKLENYKKILEMDLLSLHPKKQERFINTLKNYQSIRKGGVN